MKAVPSNERTLRTELLRLAEESKKIIPLLKNRGGDTAKEAEHVVDNLGRIISYHTAIPEWRDNTPAVMETILPYFDFWMDGLDQRKNLDNLPEKESLRMIGKEMKRLCAGYLEKNPRDPSRGGVEFF